MITRQAFENGLMFDPEVLENRQRKLSPLRLPGHVAIFKWRDFFSGRLSLVQLQCHELLAQVQFALLPCFVLEDRLLIEARRKKSYANPYRQPLLGALYAVREGLRFLESWLAQLIVEPDNNSLCENVRIMCDALKEFDTFCLRYPWIFDDIQDEVQAFKKRLMEIHHYRLEERHKILTLCFEPYSENGHASIINSLMVYLKSASTVFLERDLTDLERVSGRRIEPTPEGLHAYLNEWTQRWEQEHRARVVEEKA